MKTIKIQYFAKMREEAGKSNETFMSESDSLTAIDLFGELKKQYNFSMHPHDLRVAINEEMQEWDTELENNDTVVFIQPVAGG